MKLSNILISYNTKRHNEHVSLIPDELAAPSGQLFVTLEAEWYIY